MTHTIDKEIAASPKKQGDSAAARSTGEGQGKSCPPRQSLRDLVTGQAEESLADRLFRHLESCPDCQCIVEQLERKADRLAAAAKQRREQEADQERVNRLIQKAQTLGRNEKTINDSVTVDVDGFVDGLKRCGLIAEDEVDSLLTELDHSDSSSFARELVNHQKLTTFQARVLLKGKWKGLVLGNYVILEKLGQGGMGSVFKARHQRLGRIVCVKVINSAGRKSPRVMERFRNEARTIAALSHPNFVVAHDADEAEGVPFLVMEHIDGRDLSRQVTLEGPLSPEIGLRLMHQAAEALQYAHDSGVIHRDIKPHNLVLSGSESEDSSIKILDMGLARFDNVLNEDSGEEMCAMTNTGVIMGTVDYMAPEQALRSRDADNRSDIYSLGCTMHFLLTGGAVFGGDTLMTRLVAHREASLPSIEKRMARPIAGLDPVFHKMLAKQPKDRYQSMQEVADDLQAVMEGRTPSAASAAATAEPEDSGNTSEAGTQERPILERKIRKRHTAGKTIWITTAAVLIAFALGALVSSQFNGSTTSQEVVNPEVLAVERPDADVARALIILPDHGYESKEVSEWEQAVSRLDMAVGFASLDAGVVKASDGSDAKAGVAALAEVSSDEFDILIVTGGDRLHGFLKRAKGDLGRLITQSNQSGKAILTGSATAFHEVNTHWHLYDAKADVHCGDEIHECAGNSYFWTKKNEGLEGTLKLAAVRCGLRDE